jgi:hypothetical protein
MANTDFVKSITDTIGGQFGNAGSWLWWVVGAFILVVFGLIVLGIAIWIWYDKKKWNLKVEIKLPRSDGKIINGEWGKGCFDAKRGVVFVKRKGVKGKIPVKVFDIKKYVQGVNLLTVIQLSPIDMRPIQNYSYTNHVVGTEIINGKKELIYDSIMNIKVDHGDNRAWLDSFYSASKKAFSIQNMLNQFQTPIAIAIVLISCFIGFAILWTRVGAK